MSFPKISSLLLAFAITICGGGFGWAASKIEVATIPVPKSVIYAGQRIEGHLLKQRRVPAKYLLQVSVVTNANQVSGMVARTTLMPNQPIPTNYVVVANVIEAGQPVIMVFSTGQLHITGEVIPMNSAKVGGYVRARNLSTGVIVNGIAQANGTITAMGH
ncbi:MAG: flagellar basal body P-ring formation protein FlgA [Rhizobiaceae bacterium]|nr:flagellar basal body P-ring formation protein FlgA [Rhizobiaceae bacterium]